MKKLLVTLSCAVMLANAQAARPLTTPDFSAFSFVSPIAGITKVISMADGGFVVLGRFSVWYEGVEFRNLIRFKPNGEPDMSWRPVSPTLNAFDGIATPAGVMLVGGRPENSYATGQWKYMLVNITNDGTIVPLPTDSPLQSSQSIQLGQHFGSSASIGAVVDGRVTRIDIRTGALSDSLPVYPYRTGGFYDALFDSGNGLWSIVCGDSYVGYCPANRYRLPTNFRVGDDVVLQPQPGTATYDPVGTWEFSFSDQYTYIRKMRFDASGIRDPQWNPNGAVTKAFNDFAYFWSNESGGGLRRAQTNGDGTAASDWRWSSPANMQKYHISNHWFGNGAEVTLLMELDYDVAESNAQPRVVATSSDTAADATDPTVVEYYLPQLKRYFITGRKNEQDTLDALPQSFQRTGMTFAAKSSRYRDIPEQPVCRMYFPPANGGSNTHFYGVGSDCGQLNKLGGMKYEGYDFSVLRPAGGLCTAAAPHAVTRLYNNKAATNESNHRYVISEATKARMLAQGWIDEGPVFCTTAVTDSSS